jgi:hypothetical protein
VFVGSAIVAGSGLFVIWRERASGIERIRTSAIEGRRSASESERRASDRLPQPDRPRSRRNPESIWGLLFTERAASCCRSATTSGNARWIGSPGQGFAV